MRAKSRYKKGKGVRLSPSSADGSVTFVTPTGKEFAGFFFQDEPNNCEGSRLAVYYQDPAPDPCVTSTAISLNLGNINGKTKNLFDGMPSVLSFTATDNTLAADGCPAMVY
jgi:hypothetical protein